MKYIFVLGRHAALSVAEIKAVLSDGGVVGEPAGRFVLVDTTAPPLLPRLGGVDRIVEVLAEQDHMFTPEEIVPILPYREATKVTLGISGLPHQAAKALGIGLKKALRDENKSVRFIIPNGKTSLLNAAQVLFNSLLLASQNVEMVFVVLRGRFYVGRTVQIQDIQAYERRDTARPMRDAKIGMLPPKLAQIMLNLAVHSGSATVYDPFCGTGVVLQEGWLMGFTMIGSDSNPKMVAAAQVNLKYVLGSRSPLPRLFKHDVQQPFPENMRGKVDAVVTEPYLGRPLATPLSPAQIAGAQKELRGLYRNFFRNSLAILRRSGVVLFVLPVFRQVGGTWVYFEETFLDELAELGYVRKQLVPGGRLNAVYSRPEAVVGRELTLWQKLSI